MNQPAHSLIRVCILFGGESAEHDISILSAKNVALSLDRQTFQPSFIYIDKQGGWHAATNAAPTDSSQESGINMSLLDDVDVVFPVLHGPKGEDGTLQGLLEMRGVPYVGCRVLSSAVCMDKDISKRLLRDAQIPVAKHMTLYRNSVIDDKTIVEELGLPLFVKPANMGSSIGVSKVSKLQELQAAIHTAFAYDRKIVLEQAVVGSEIECAVLGSGSPQASAIGKIVPAADFYTYDAKYKDEQGTVLQMPADIPAPQAASAQSLALEAYKTLGCEGLARVDMFLRADGTLIVNEINTMPGFTQFSMYPSLWNLSGINPTELSTRLIKQALDS